ncbi:hypothetical protein FQZ97_1140710 [compost metagenome]
MGDLSELFAGVADQGLALFADGHVAAQGQGAPTETADLLGHCFDIREGAGGADHVGAGLCIGEGNGAANAAAATGNDGHTAGQVEALQNAHGGPCCPSG